MTGLGSPLTRTLIVLVAACALVATPSIADARTHVHTDPRGDMTEVSVSPYEPRPDQVNGDIVRIRAQHTRSRIKVRLVFAELQQTTIVFGTNYRFWTPDGKVRGVHFDAQPGSWRGTGFMNFVNGGKRIRCAMHFAPDYATNVIALGFSRRCLKNPRWVRISASMMTSVPDGSGMGFPPIYADNAQRTGIVNAIHNNPTPRLRRG